MKGTTMTKLDLAKKAANIVVGFGTTHIVYSIIRNNVTTEKPTEKVSTAAGALVIGSMAADATQSYTDRKIDEAAAWWKQNVTKS